MNMNIVMIKGIYTNRWYTLHINNWCRCTKKYTPNIKTKLALCMCAPIITLWYTCHMTWHSCTRGGTHDQKCISRTYLMCKFFFERNCMFWFQGIHRHVTLAVILLIHFSYLLSASRGFVFGLWSACASVGNILGAFLASSVLKYGYEVRAQYITSF